MGANYVKIHEIMPKKMLGKTIKFYGLFMGCFGGKLIHANECIMHIPWLFPHEKPPMQLSLVHSWDFYILHGRFMVIPLDNIV